MIIQEPSFEVVRKSDPDYTRGAFRLTERMVYQWAAKKCYVEIPEGTITNFASIPFGLRNIYSVNGAHRLPATLHDYLYSEAGEISYPGTTIKYTRKEADKEFYRFMIKEGVGKLKAKSMYRGVRIFGGVHLRATGGIVF